MDMGGPFWVWALVVAFFLATALFAWWLIGRADEAVANANQAAEHSMTAAQDANRVLNRADQLLDHLTEWWDQLADEADRREAEPPTNPIRRQRTDTEEAATVITPQAIVDQPQPARPDPAVEQWAREQMAEIVARVEGQPEKPAPKKRVARKSTA